MKNSYFKSLVPAFVALFIFAQSGSAQTWSALGAGLQDDSLAISYSLCAYNNNLVAAGFFQTAGSVTGNSIAQWNGAAWSALGSGFPADVNFYGILGMAVYNGALYAGGEFDSAGGIAAANIAQWNGTSWMPVGNPGLLGVDYASYVEAMIVYHGNLITGGSYDNASTINVWNGSAWSQMDSTFVYGGVNSFTIYQGNLYAGGYFFDSNYTLYGLAEWNGSTWNPMAPIASLGFDYEPSVYTLGVYNGNLIVGGFFDSIGDAAATNLAQWDGNTWSEVGGGILPADTSYVTTVDSFQGNLYVGGYFNEAGTTPAYGLAEWNGNAWSAPGNISQYGTCSTLLTDNYNLYAGGDYTSIGTTDASNIAVLRNCVTEVINVPVTITCGDSLSFGGLYYYQEGNYSDTITSAGGCDTITVLQLTVNPDTTYLNDTICNVDSILFNGQYYATTGTYTAQFTTSANCDSTVLLNLQVEICGGIQNIAANELFSLYPNPADDYAMVAVNPGAVATSTLKLLDETGRELLRMKITAPLQRLPLSFLPAGIYTVAVEAGGQRAVKLLVKTE